MTEIILLIPETSCLTGHCLPSLEDTMQNNYFGIIIFFLNSDAAKE